MYQKTDWRDHVTDKPGLYIITDNKDGTWTITPAGKVMQQGTPQDQEHFNNIENGVWDIYAALGMMFNTVRQQGWQLNEAVATIDNSWQSEKLVNGFKLAYNGSAKSATIKYIAIGGTLK